MSQAEGCGHIKGGVGWCAKCLKDTYTFGIMEGKRQIREAVDRVK